MRCAIYRRVSTDIQREEGFSLEAQAMRLNAYAVSQGWTIVDDYTDEGYSAKNIDRPALQKMIKDMEQKKFDVLLVYRLDRLVRNVRDLHELLETMDKYDVAFQSATEPFETKTATGRMFITIVATLAQWERETIAERVFENMLKRSETGLRNGGPAPYGYISESGKLIKHPEESKWVEFIFSQYQTHGSQNIAKQLNTMGVRTKKGEIWSDFSVRYTLRNPIYSGYIRWNNESVSSGHRKKTGEEVIVPIEQDDFEPVITKEVWDQTQKLLEQRSHMAFRSENHYPFSGIAICSCCGKSFTGAKRNRKYGDEYRFYKCQGRFKFGICDVQTIAESSIEEEFLSILDLEEVEPTVKSRKVKPEMDPEKLKVQLAKINDKKKRAKELYIDGDETKDEYNERMKKLNAEEMELMKLLDVEDEIASEFEIRQLLKEIKKEWYNLSYETRKRTIHGLFESITIELVEPSKPGRTPIPAVIKITDYQLR
ncbi:recombinase family protein [Ornithinibacillus sp. JPR2-1]|uniref:recombinase family protein n=1 Tax=Ornithinibacillus sp. JPR2-1 TaxID=2094019 RepID=UPI0031DED93B